MPIRLPAEIDAAIKKQGSPLHIVGADESTSYVLLTEEQFEHYRQVLEMGPLTLEEQQTALRHIGERVGWDDPAMDDYDSYDLHRAKQQS